MPLGHSYTTLVPLSTETANIMSGSFIEFAPRDGTYRIWARHSAVGAEVLVAHIMLGGGQQIQRNTPMQKAAGAIVRDQDLVAQFSVTKGTQVIVTLQETGGVNATPNVKVEFS